MKRRIVVGGIMLSLVGLLLAGCGGVAQEDLDAAEAATAAAEAATAAAEAATAALQTELDAAQTAKAMAQAEAIIAQDDLDAALVRIADLEAGVVEEPVAEVPVIETSFEAATFSSEALGVSYQYPADWTVSAYPPALLYATSADYSSLTIFTAFDIGNAATASELLEVAHPGTTIESETETTTADGTAATEYTVLYEDAGYDVAAWALVVQTDTNWFVLEAGGYTAFGAIAEELALEILGTLILD